MEPTKRSSLAPKVFLAGLFVLVAVMVGLKLEINREAAVPKSIVITPTSTQPDHEPENEYHQLEREQFDRQQYATTTYILRDENGIVLGMDKIGPLSTLWTLERGSDIKAGSFQPLDDVKSVIGTFDNYPDEIHNSNSLSVKQQSNGVLVLSAGGFITMIGPKSHRWVGLRPSMDGGLLINDQGREGLLTVTDQGGCQPTTDGSRMCFDRVSWNGNIVFSLKQKVDIERSMQEDGFFARLLLAHRTTIDRTLETITIPLDESRSFIIQLHGEKDPTVEIR